MPEPISLDALIAIDHLLSEEEKMVRETVRRFVQQRYLPRAAELFEEEKFPAELIPELGELGLLGASLSGYGCAGMSPTMYGLALAELEYGDSGLRSFASVQGSLAMFPIWKYGSEEQKQRWLPGMARGELVGCFGLTEPDAGSDPGAMKTRARRDGKDWVLNGAKMWITSSPICQLAVVWAKTEGDDPRSIRGFVVERGMKGFETPLMKGKMSLRASPTGEIVLSDVRVPDANMLPEVVGLRGPLSCLTQARFGIARQPPRAAMEIAIEQPRLDPGFAAPLRDAQPVALHEGAERGAILVARISTRSQGGFGRNSVACAASRTCARMNGGGGRLPETGAAALRRCRFGGCGPVCNIVARLAAMFFDKPDRADHGIALHGLHHVIERKRRDTDGCQRLHLYAGGAAGLDRRADDDAPFIALRRKFNRCTGNGQRMTERDQVRRALGPHDARKPCNR